MTEINQNEKLEYIAQRVENVIADRDNHGLLVHTNTSSTASPISLRVLQSNGDKPQKVPEVVKEIIMHDFGDTDDDEESIKDLQSQKSPNTSKDLGICTYDINLKSIDELRLENQNLKSNLNNLKDDFIRIKAERDYIVTQYNILNDKFYISNSDVINKLDIGEYQLKSDQPNQYIDVESVFFDLKEEKAKCLNLVQINGLLRDQIDEETYANIGLTEDVQILNEDCQILKSELSQSDYIRKHDEATLRQYFASEHKRIRTHWYTSIYFKKQFSDIKTPNERYLHEKCIEKLKTVESNHDEEMTGLIKAVNDAEHRCTKIELLRRGLEGELQRIKMRFNDKENENQVLKDRIYTLIKQITDLESKLQKKEEIIRRNEVHQLHVAPF